MVIVDVRVLIEDLHGDDQDAHSHENRCQHPFCDVRRYLSLDARAYLSACDDARYRPDHHVPCWLSGYGVDARCKEHRDREDGDGRANGDAWRYPAPQDKL